LISYALHYLRIVIKPPNLFKNTTVTVFRISTSPFFPEIQAGVDVLIARMDSEEQVFLNGTAGKW